MLIDKAPVVAPATTINISTSKHRLDPTEQIVRKIRRRRHKIIKGENRLEGEGAESPDGNPSDPDAEPSKYVPD